MDGAGKTTAMNYVKQAIEEEGYQVTLVNILSGHPTSAEIRKIVTGKDSILTKKAEMLLYAAAITNTYQLEVLPLLKQGMNVLIDRGPLSNFAYQVQTVKTIEFDLWRRFYSEFMADATLILTCDLEEGLKRCAWRDGALDRIESRPSDFHKAVHDAYMYVRELSVASERIGGQNDFSDVLGKSEFYSNNASLEHLAGMCRYFVQKTLTTSA